MKSTKTRKNIYLCGDNVLILKPNRTMRMKNNKPISILEKMLEDKKAIQKCIREGGDLKKVAEERNVKFATPI